MDGKVIEVDIDVGAEDYRRILFWYSKSRLIITGVLAAILSLILGAMAVFVGFSNSSRGLRFSMLLPAALPAVLVSFVFLLTIFNIRKQAVSVATTTEPTRAIFSEHEVQMISASSTVVTLWNKFVKLKETETDFIFFFRRSEYSTLSPNGSFYSRMKLTNSAR